MTVRLYELIPRHKLCIYTFQILSFQTDIGFGVVD